MTLSNEPTTGTSARPPVCPPDCPDCTAQAAEEAEWAARDLEEIEAEHRAVLARHDDGCISEAIADAFATGHDETETAWFVAAQLLDDGHSACRCASEASPARPRA